MRDLSTQRPKLRSLRCRSRRRPHQSKSGALQARANFATDNLPLDKLFNAAKRGWKGFVVGQVIDHGENGVLALHMELRMERSLGEKVRIDASQTDAGDLGKEIGAAILAAHPPGRLHHHRGRLSPHDLDGDRGIDRRRNIGRAMRGLAVVAMTIELGDGFAGNS